VQRSSLLCGTARAPHLRLACYGSPGRAVARMAGSPFASLRPPANRRPRSRRRGKGAEGGRLSGFPCGAAGSCGSGTPLPFPSSSPCCPGFFFANGSHEFCERGAHRPQSLVRVELCIASKGEHLPGPWLCLPDQNPGQLANLKSETNWARVDALTREEMERQAKADDGPLPEG